MKIKIVNTENRFYLFEAGVWVNSPEQALCFSTVEGAVDVIRVLRRQGVSATILMEWA